MLVVVLIGLTWLWSGWMAYGLVVTHFVTQFPSLLLLDAYATAYPALLKTSKDYQDARALINSEWVALRRQGCVAAVLGPVGWLALVVLNGLERAWSFPIIWTRQGAEMWWKAKQGYWQVEDRWRTEEWE